MMKSMILAVSLAAVAVVSVASTASAERFTDKSYCERLYITGYDNMSLIQKMNYNILCKPHGWA